MGKNFVEKQRQARRVLEDLFRHPDNVLVIHYSCESFYDRTDGRSPRITSLAARKLGSGQTTSFSIHQVAERQGVGVDAIEAEYDRFERQMLEEFYGFVRPNQNCQWLHWNMRDINYGFAAIEHRLKVLGGDPVAILDAQRVDLSRLMVALYGVKYIGHPRLEKLVDKNRITKNGFLTGKEEADAFESKNYVALHQSTLRKADLLANVAERANDGSLKTNAGWWDLHGGGLRQFVDGAKDHPLVVISGVATTVIPALGWIFEWPVLAPIKAAVLAWLSSFT